MLQYCRRGFRYKIGHSRNLVLTLTDVENPTPSANKWLISEPNYKLVISNPSEMVAKRHVCPFAKLHDLTT